MVFPVRKPNMFAKIYLHRFIYYYIDYCTFKMLERKTKIDIIFDKNKNTIYI